uniref:G_PROTEIN_RECEP_F2_4 domain-containing protein n=1 Tax=Panagrellus redivivus TaxID=6233 RepID=A0A7E4WCU4_PANRE
MKIIRLLIVIGCVLAVGFGKEFGEISELSKNFRASHFECQSKKWYCQRECRLQFFESSGSCRQPRADETCFGAPITYNYTWNHVVTRFPQEFELIKRFPSCWSVLGPLLCSTIYRPCSKNEFYIAGKQAPGILEMWQVFPKTVCETARNACPFVVEAGLWPSFLKCEDTVALKDNEPQPTFEDEEKQKIFSPVSSCKYLGKGTSFPVNQCLWPLVAGPNDLKRASLHHADPVMDSCFMPCETPMTGFEWVLEQFRFRNSLIAGLVGAVFLLITIYLIAFSKIYSSSLSIFCLGQAFLCATVYLAVWVLSGSEGFRHVGMCIDNGRIRRSSKMHLLNSCALETLVLTCTAISGYLWIFSIFLLRILRPRIRNNNSFTFGQRGNDHSARLWLAGGVYLIPVAIVGLAAVIFWNELPMDVFSGICHVAAGSTGHSIVYYGTLVTAMLIVITTGAIVAIQSAIRKRRLHNSLRRRNLPQNRRQHPLLVNIEDGFDRDGNGKQLKHYKTEGRQKLSPEKVYAREHGLGEGLISDVWLGGIFASIAISLGMGIFIQYGVLQGSVGSAWERRRVAESVKCSLSSITPNPPFWWNRTLHHDDVTHEADPFLRKAQLFNAATAPGCDLPTVGNVQLIGLFLTTIILPSLPYWILSVCFLAGFCGHGIQSVRKMRQHLNPFIRDEEEEIKLDPFLNAEEQFLPPKENIELECVAASVTGFSHIENEHGIDARAEPNVEVEAANDQSALTVPTTDPMLVKYIDELKSSQIQQEQQITTLQKIVADGFMKFDEFTEVIAKQHSAPHNLADSDTSSTTSPVVTSRNRRHQPCKKPKEEAIPTGKSKHPQYPPKLINVTPQLILEAQEAARNLLFINVRARQRTIQPWMLPNPPTLTWEFWDELQHRYRPGDRLILQFADIMGNVLLRLIEHCVENLPYWMSRYFRETAMSEFNDLYGNDLDIREIMELLDTFTDAEPIEAAADESLHTYLTPMAVKAVKNVCVQCHIDSFYLASTTSVWFNTNVEINRLKAMMINPESAMNEAYAEIIDVFSNGPSDSDVDMEEPGDKRPASSCSSTDTATPAKRQKIEDVNVAADETEVSTDAANAPEVVPMMVDSVPPREMTPMPADVQHEYLVQITTSCVSSLLLNGWTRPPMPRTGYKYLFYMFDFEHPSNPSKVFYEEALMDYGEEIQRQAVKDAMTIFNGDASQYEEDDEADLDPSITFPANIQYYLDKFATTENGQVAFTLEEMYPDAIVRATLTEAEIAVATNPEFQAVYVQCLINCHSEAVEELAYAPFVWAALPIPAELDEIVRQLMNDPPNEEDPDSDP